MASILSSSTNRSWATTYNPKPQPPHLEHEWRLTGWSLITFPVPRINDAMILGDSPDRTAIPTLLPLGQTPCLVLPYFMDSLPQTSRMLLSRPLPTPPPPPPTPAFNGLTEQSKRASFLIWARNSPLFFKGHSPLPLLEVQKNDKQASYLCIARTHPFKWKWEEREQIRGNWKIS